MLNEQDQLLALDAKIQFDDNALFRHKDFLQLMDPKEKDDKENEADKAHLNYVALDGNIACLVNGAGLAMASTSAESRLISSTWGAGRMPNKCRLLSR